ncbi:hypothetical protein LEMLEM_LOCUS3631 [Lemmus lemmus]
MSRTARLAEGRQGGAPVHTGAPGAGPAASPGKAPAGGGRLADKSPQGAPRGPLALLGCGAGPAPTSGPSRQSPFASPTYGYRCSARACQGPGAVPEQQAGLVPTPEPLYFSQSPDRQKVVLQPPCLPFPHPASLTLRF